MIIKVGSVYLCAGYTSNEHVFEFTSDCIRAVQDSKPIGASAAKPINRANLATVREFAVEKISSDLKTAEELINSHEATAMAASGSITFQAETSGATGTLSDGVLESVRLVQWNGVCTVWRYRIRGGVLTVA